jgi:hypothetical protein
MPESFSRGADTFAVYNYAGTFTYDNGTTIDLEGGIGINGGIDPW